VVYLSSRYHSVRIGDKQSSSCYVPYGVPEGSISGPLLFIIYVADVAEIPDRHALSSHFYADDVQLYLTCRVVTYAVRVSACIDEINNWMASNRLTMNRAKTDVYSVHQVTTRLFCRLNLSVYPCTTFYTIVRNLGVMFDKDLSLTSHMLIS